MAAVSLGGVTLPAGLQWTNRTATHAIVQSVEYALDGSPVIFSAQRLAGRLITLEAFEDSGWIDQDMANGLLWLAEQSLAPVNALAFSYDDFSAWVLFAHHTPPALELKPLFPFTPVYSGRIALITV